MPDIRVLSFNVRMLPGPFGDGDIDLERATAIARRMKDYDVVCLQELFDEEAREVFLDAAFAQGFPGDSIVAKLWDDWLHEDSGLFFASRLPFASGKDYGYEEFDDNASLTFDSLADKGIFAAPLDVGGGKRLYVFHTHMQSDVQEHEYTTVRERQLEQIRRLMVRALQKESNLANVSALFLGDMNVIGETKPPGYGLGPRTAEYQSLVARMGSPIDVFRAANPTSPGYTWDGVNNGRTGNRKGTGDGIMQRLDYFFALTRLPLESRDPRFCLAVPQIAEAKVQRMRVNNPVGGQTGPLSDHYGVSAVITP